MLNEQHWQQPPPPWIPDDSEPESFLEMLYAPIDGPPPPTNHHPNENAPPTIHAPAKYPVRHPPAAPPPLHDPTFTGAGMQYHPRAAVAGATAVQHRHGLALQPDTHAYHLNVCPGNPAVPAAYGYDGPHQMPVHSNIPAGPRGVAFPGQAAPWPLNQDSRRAPDTQVHEPDWQAYTGVLDLRVRAQATMAQAAEVVEEAGTGVSAGSDEDSPEKRRRKKNTTPRVTKRGGSKRKTKEDKGKAKARGAGSKSSNLHHRSLGASDDEVAELSAAARHAAEPRLSNAQQRELQKRDETGEPNEDEDEDEDEDDRKGEDSGSSEELGSDDDDVKKWGLNDTEKLQAVEYLTVPERYEQIRTSLAKFCLEIAQCLFQDKVEVGQIRNYWNNNAFAKYKAIRTQLSHMGGGDPDAVHSESPTPSGSNRPKKPTDVTFTPTRKFLSSILLGFYESKLYDLIDAVYVVPIALGLLLGLLASVYSENSTHKDSAIERTHKINSFDPPVPDSGSTKQRRARPSQSPEKNSIINDSFLQQAFQDIAKHSKQAQRLEEERLALARRQDAREEADRLEQQDFRRQTERKQREDARAVRWTLAVEMTKSPLEEVRARALKLMERLEEEEKEEHTANM